MFPNYFQRLARYNRWANGVLYSAAADLPESEYFKDKGAYFGGLHATLTHLVVTDRIWMKRLSGEGETYTDLKARPFDTFQALAAAREAEDAWIIAWVDSLNDGHFAETFEYRNMAGDPFKSPLDLVLGHFFNHQTHHRGQAHALLSALGHDAPSMDIIYFTRD